MENEVYQGWLEHGGKGRLPNLVRIRDVSRCAFLLFLVACGHSPAQPPGAVEHDDEVAPVAEMGRHVELRGPCVTPPQREYIVESLEQEANPRDDGAEPLRRETTFRTTRPFDVDGDGVLDALVPFVPEGRCAPEVDYAIYVMRGECGYHVGRVTGPVSLDEGVHEGLQDLIATRRWSELTDESRPAGPDNVATQREVVTPWRARGGRYQPGSSAISAGVCHHCAIARCRTLSGPPPAEESCDPLPNEGDICEGHGFCPVDWGSPGGQSSALWCRGGRWTVELERNEP